MGYFANGSAGSRYETQYCDRCIHRRNARKGECCPVWMIHLLWNGDADEDRAMVLDMLIPPEGTHNQQCEMFVEHADPLEWEIYAQMEDPRTAGLSGMCQETMCRH